MITINLPDVRSINIDTDDKDAALSAANTASILPICEASTGIPIRPSSI